MTEIVRNSHPGAGTDVLEINELLRKMISMEGSELILSCGTPPTIVDKGKRLVPIGEEVVQGENTLKVAFHCLNPAERETFKRRNVISKYYNIEGFGRFYMTAFISNGSIRMLFKPIHRAQGLLKDYPSVMRRLLETNPGRVLICYGDDTRGNMLSAIIDYYNQNFDYKIVIISEGIPSLHYKGKSRIFPMMKGNDFDKIKDVTCALSEFGADILCFDDMVSEESVQALLTNQLSAQMVIMSVPALSAVGALHQILHVMPFWQERSARRILADTLCGMFGQQEMTTKFGRRKRIFEIMIKNKRIAEILRDYSFEPDLDSITAEIEKGSEGMISFDQSIGALTREGHVFLKDGLRRSINKERFINNYYLNEEGLFFKQI